MIHMHNTILFINKKEWNPDICDNMVETRDHYIKGNKPSTER
jgi:hypothetical protein